jgi:hypothetical protein
MPPKNGGYSSSWERLIRSKFQRLQSSWETTSVTLRWWVHEIFNPTQPPIAFITTSYSCGNPVILRWSSQGSCQNGPRFSLPKLHFFHFSSTRVRYVNKVAELSADHLWLSLENMAVYHASYLCVSKSNICLALFCAKWARLKAIFHCSRFARAGGANITQLSL